MVGKGHRKPFYSDDWRPFYIYNKKEGQHEKTMVSGWRDIFIGAVASDQLRHSSGAQQELQSVKAELAAAQAKVSELTPSLEEAESELKAAQAKSSELTSSLGKAETELETAQAELETTQKELEELDAEYEAFMSEAKSLWGSLDGYLELNSAILGINAGIVMDDLSGIEKGCIVVTGKLPALNDPTLLSFWENAYIADGDQWELKFAPFERFMAEHNGRIRSKAKVIRDKIAE